MAAVVGVECHTGSTGQLGYGRPHRASIRGHDEIWVELVQAQSGGLVHFSITWPPFRQWEQMWRYLHLLGVEGQRPWLNRLQGTWTFWIRGVSHWSCPLDPWFEAVLEARWPLPMSLVKEVSKCEYLWKSLRAKSRHDAASTRILRSRSRTR